MDIASSKRLVLALAIHRAPHIRSDEKLLLWDLVDDELSLSRLSHRALEEALGRSLAGRPWRPDELLALAREDAEYLARSGCAYLHYDDPGYPALLRETARPPFGLFFRGPAMGGDATAVAVVGTRCPTGVGLSAALSIAADLASAGACVVSGLARGIDGAAHRGALSGRRRGGAPRPWRGAGAPGAAGTAGATCAVLPCGIDRVYPPANKELASAILEGGGCLVSEYPPGDDLRTYRFPERNRIIAGMARSCLVVEAPAKSGALITAEHALDEGRDVWVARACLGGSRGAGIDRLAMDGAGIADSAADILADIGLSSGIPGARGAESARSEEASEGRRLAALLGEELGP